MVSPINSIFTPFCTSTPSSFSLSPLLHINIPDVTMSSLGQAPDIVDTSTPFTTLKVPDICDIIDNFKVSYEFNQLQLDIPLDSDGSPPPRWWFEKLAKMSRSGRMYLWVEYLMLAMIVRWMGLMCSRSTWLLLDECRSGSSVVVVVWLWWCGCGIGEKRRWKGDTFATRYIESWE